MRDILIAAIVFGLIPYIFRHPYIGVYVWSWLSYMNPHRLTYGFAYNFPFAMVAGVATILATIFTKDRKNIPWSPLTVMLVVWVLWLSFTTLFAQNPEWAMWEWKRTMKIQLMTFVMLMLIRDRKQINGLVWVIVISLGFYGVKGGLFTIMTGGSYRVWGPEGSFVSDNNTLALALIMIIPLMRYLQLHTENVWLKRILLLSIILVAFSIISSYSRGALLAGTAMTLVLFLKSQKKLVLGFMLVIVAVILLTFMPSEWGERMHTLENVEEDASAMGRVNAWWFAYNLASDKLLTGGGFQTFTRELFYIYAPIPEDFHDAHSIYFEVLAEQGFIGLFIFLTMGVLALRSGRWIIKNTKGKDEFKWALDLAAMVQVSLIGYAVGGAFLGLAYYDLPYNLFAILIILKKLVENESKTVTTNSLP